MDAITQLKDLIDKYDLHKDQYLDAKYNETEVRVDFVNPFFELLGWDVNNKAGLPSHLREVTHEADVVVEEDGKEKIKNRIIHLRSAQRFNISWKQKSQQSILQKIVILHFSLGVMAGMVI